MAVKMLSEKKNNEMDGRVESINLDARVVQQGRENLFSSFPRFYRRFVVSFKFNYCSGKFIMFSSIFLCY